MKRIKGGKRMGKCNKPNCDGDLISRYPYTDGFLQCSKCRQTISMKRI